MSLIHDSLQQLENRRKVADENEVGNCSSGTAQPGKGKVAWIILGTAIGAGIASLLYLVQPEKEAQAIASPTVNTTVPEEKRKALTTPEPEPAIPMVALERTPQVADLVPAVQKEKQGLSVPSASRPPVRTLSSTLSVSEEGTPQPGHQVVEQGPGPIRAQGQQSSRERFRVQQLIDNIRSLVRQQNMQKAEEALQQLKLKVSETSLTYKRLRAYVSARQGNLDAAMVAYEEILQQLPRDEEALSNLSLLLVQNGRLDQARHYIERLQQYHPEEATTRQLTAYLEKLK